MTGKGKTGAEKGLRLTEYAVGKGMAIWRWRDGDVLTKKGWLVEYTRGKVLDRWR